MTDNANAIATRDSGAIDIIPIPRALSDLGVKIAEDDAGNRLVLIPAAVRQAVNVIDPVTSLVQADPNWTPRISVAELNPDAKNGPHFYEQKGGKVAPTKQALEVLAKAAGILYTRTSRIARDFLSEDEPWAYSATVGIRRSDGTVEEITRERSAGEDAKDRAHGREKTESKAVLRAIRAALQIPHTFTPQDAAKPFLVIGFNFTPDYNDVETRRMLVSAGLNAQSTFYGTPAGALPAGETVDLESGEITAAEETTRPDDSEPSQTPSGSEHYYPQDDGGEYDDPESEPEPAAAAVSDETIDAAGDTELPDGKRDGTIRTVVDASVAGDTDAQDWLLWALSPRRLWHRKGEAFDTALDVYVQHRDPALWTRSVEANRIDGQS